ncbi:hypothetical protein G7066_05785 [Leucobacter coleopterorum]|uniref:Uncharacterized protein n=2 Tax=Leucobacter coleopterorum TaxID=2714933 RepID=A0ABX6JZR5_9MICO|nr:hypothetical protein [Leucobacter coleopterorum]QIM18285.1 hypothetical protein G7066_05785 [Leucobacter coleopterorum]
MSEPHQKRAVEWFLTLHEQSLEEAMQHALPAKAAAPEPAKPEHPDEPDTPLYGTALSPDEGLWLRTGWAGRG